MAVRGDHVRDCRHWSDWLQPLRSLRYCPRMSSLTAIGVLDFWFSDRARPLWFKTDPEFDDEIRSRFGSVVARPDAVAAAEKPEADIRLRFGSVIAATANGE